MTGFDRAVFDAVTIPPIPVLAQLRETVLAHSVTRMPKWKFRLADDLVIQLQPKPSLLLGEYARTHGGEQHVIDFDGRCWIGADLTRDVVDRTPPAIQFRLFASTPAAWTFKPYRTHGGSLGKRDQLVAAVTPAAFETLPAIMFSPQCLVCGRALVDPASAARFIGPECSGTSSLTMRTIDLAATS